METTSVFIHGLQGSSRGTKARFFKKHFPEMKIADYRGSLSNRLSLLHDVVSGLVSFIIVGSSYGGLMGTIYACEHPKQVKKLILLAPALSFHEFDPWKERQIPVQTHIFHGIKDEVVPWEPVRTIAERVFSQLAFHPVNDDHVLSKTFHTFNWHALLKDKM
jgi:pimeloyl-ACP methyl ester carboxylesterase